MAKNNKMFYGWWIVITAFMSMTFLFTPIVNLISFFTDPVSQELGIERSQFSLYFTIVTLVGLVVAPIAGKILKKVNIRVFMTVCTLLGALSFVGFSFASNIYVFYALSVLQGISLIAGSIVPSSVLITNWFNEKRGLALGIALSGSGLGGIILSPVVSSLINSVGWRTTYLIIGIVIAVTIVPLTAFVVRFHPSDMGLTPLGQAPTKDKNQVLSGMNQKDVLRTPSFWILCAAIIVTGIVANTMIINLAPFLTDIGATSSRAAFLLSLGSAMVIVGKLLVGRMFDKMGLTIMIIFLGLCNVLSFVFLRHADGQIAGILYATFTGFGATALTIAPSYITAYLFGEKDFSSIFGTVSMFSSLGTALSAVFGGVVYGINNSYGLVLTVLIVLSCVSAALYFLAAKTKPKYESASLPQPDQVVGNNA
ncbi:MFS transporter [Paenibacillus polygoni]|uniref:MFS transporter n=1 Tax=Paenibacillus polygoni TaxID=3050112 RepID=A0ABY8X1N3_9BACL|nr:MFS transporter [Paenibacillus polygoni]WIV19425.1 MFS transporter [Paenibacillus polygoni]